jgi:hypothetical protein
LVALNAPAMIALVIGIAATFSRTPPLNLKR